MKPPLAVLLVVPLAGCEALQDVADSLQRPSAKLAGASLADLTTEGVTVRLDVAVTNPYAVALPVAGLDFSLSSDGAALLSGAAEAVDPLAARSTGTLPVMADLRFDDLLRVLPGIRPGAVVPYDGSVDVRVDAPGLGPLSLPVRFDGELPIPAVPRVSLASVGWDALSFDEARATLALDVTNTNAFAIDLDDLALELGLGGTRVASVNTRPAGSIDPGATRRLEIPISFAPADFGIALLGMLKGDGASYGVAGDLGVDTPFGPLVLPFDRSGTTAFTR